jgi:cell division protein FtsZ
MTKDQNPKKTYEELENETDNIEAFISPAASVMSMYQRAQETQEANEEEDKIEIEEETMSEEISEKEAVFQSISKKTTVSDSKPKNVGKDNNQEEPEDNYDLDQASLPKILVVGVGGAGCNAINNMIASKLEGVEFIAANTDVQTLVNSKAHKTINLGRKTTKGLGAGARPEVGKASAEESIEDIRSVIKGANMIFIAAGMGGGTGTGAAPVIAQLAKEEGILTVAVVTKPFNFEGKKRMVIAEDGIENLSPNVDTLIVIPNQNLFKVADVNTSFIEAFKMADNVLYSGVSCITDLMVKPGLINLDFADVKTTMLEMGKAMMGAGLGEGENRAVEAAEAAIANPLLDTASMKGAKGVLINITGGSDMTLAEVDEAANRIREEIEEDGNIIFGACYDQNIEGALRVSVVATGIDDDALSTLSNYSNSYTTRKNDFNFSDVGVNSAAQEKSNTFESTEEKPNTTEYAAYEEVDIEISDTSKNEEINNEWLNQETEQHTKEKQEEAPQETQPEEKREEKKSFMSNFNFLNKKKAENRQTDLISMLKELEEIPTFLRKDKKE